MKLQIKSIFHSVLFEYETKDNTIRKTLEKAVTDRANLNGAYLRRADLRETDMRGARLYGADLYKANLYRVNLRGADLRETDMRETDLRRADLRETNMRGASLYGADLRGADLRETDGLDIWWHVHHEVLYEILTEPIRNRINYIKKEKPKNEIDIRLRLLKPVLGEIPKDEKGWEKLHKKECPDCSWNGKTIFPKKIH